MVMFVILRMHASSYLHYCSIRNEGQGHGRVKRTMVPFMQIADVHAAHLVALNMSVVGLLRLNDLKKLS